MTDQITEKKSLDISRIANRMSQIRPSGLRKLFDLEREISPSIKRKVLSFGLGNLNIPVHDAIIRQLKAVLDDPVSHRYSSNAGIWELREQLVKKYDDIYGITYAADQFVVTAGALEALMDTFLALINPGDEVLIPIPAFGYFANHIRLAGGKTRTIETNSKFELDPDVVNEAITPRTKALVLNFPNNPTGSVMDSSQIRAIVETAADKGILVISDESYEYITYEGHKHTCASEFSLENVLVVSSFSKTYAMTGFRVGYVVGPRTLIPHILLLHQHNTACTTTVSQYAAKIALESPPSIRETLVQELAARRLATIDAFTSIDGIELNYAPKGAFYIFPDVSGTGMDGTEFSEYLLKHAQVVVVPGEEFGVIGKNHVRVAYGFLEVSEINEAGKRIHDVFANG
ncbi:MAG: pyridoxal phosphate-dependent aminotransferase [Candidatus Heimdallarchaeota archaeon]